MCVCVCSAMQEKTGVQLSNAAAAFSDEIDADWSEHSQRSRHKRAAPVANTVLVRPTVKCLHLFHIIIGLKGKG